MQKKHVALLLPSLANGGAERVMLNIAHGLAADDNINVDLVLCKAQGPYLQQVNSSVQVVDLNSSRIATSILPLIRYLRTTKPDSVLSALDTTNLILIWAAKAALSKARIVVSVHCNFSSALAGQKHQRAKLLPWLVKQFYPWANSILAVSKGVADDLVECTGLKKDLITVQVNPVITPELEAKHKADCTHPWMNENIPVVLATGRMTYQKNFELLLRAFALARKEIEARLVILGEGELQKDLQQLAIDLDIANDVNFPGFVENPYSYMKQAAVFVLSSRFEGLPTVLIEALFCGAKVISTDCPSGPSEILEQGRLGTLIPVNEVEAMSSAIVSSLTKSSESESPTNSLSKYFLNNVVTSYKKHILPRQHYSTGDAQASKSRP